MLAYVDAIVRENTITVDGYKPIKQSVVLSKT